ncbi:MAG TPA: GNAT family N-acetyltransferase [Bacteroidetes bacterium]|nr:GNAT family N-acetyltransferase [Bacteroidota bacterium]
MIYINEDIILRQWHHQDAELLAELANNFEIAKNLSDQYPYPYSLQNAKDYINHVLDLKPFSIFAIEYKGKLAGSFGYIFHKDIWKKNIELGYWLAQDYWGQGIMTNVVKNMIDFAFQNFDINRVIAKVFGSNYGSRKVCEKAGMIKEAVLKNSIYKNGKYFNEIIYSIQKNQPFYNYLDIFNKTKYYFYSNKEYIEINLYAKNPKIDSLLKNEEGWAFITAHNPLPEILSDQENEKRNKSLEKDIKKNNLSFLNCKNNLDDWEESGFLIKNIDLDQAINWGKKYKQKAIVYAKINKPAELIFIM